MHWLYLLCIFLLIILLCFTNKEGLYSNADITAAKNEMSTLKKKVKDAIKSVELISENKLNTQDIIAKLTPMFETDQSKNYTSGILIAVKSAVDDLSDLQNECEKMNNIFKQINQSEFMPIMGKMTTIPKGLELISKQIDEIETKMSKLPDR